jgi:signal transduction histidine kinase
MRCQSHWDPHFAMDAQEIKGLDQSTLQVLIDALPDYVLLLDQARKIVAVNQALTSALGIDSEHLRGADRFTSKDTADGSVAGFLRNEIVKMDCPSQREVHDANADTWALISTYPISGGVVTDKALCLCVLKDITYDKSVTLKLSRSLEQENGLNSILRAVQAAQTPTQVLEVTIDQVLQVSWLGMRTSAAGFLMQAQQLRKVVNRNLPPAVEQGCARVSLGACLCGRVAKNGESIVCAHVDDRHVHYEGILDHGHVILPLKWQSQVLGVLCFYLAAGQVLDGHSRRFLEAAASIAATAIGRLYYGSQLAQSERLSSVGLLAAGVAHEIKNPLGTILTIAEWLVEDLPPILEQCRTLRERLTEELGAERANALMADTPALRNDKLLQDMAQGTRSALDGVHRVSTIVQDLGMFSRADDHQIGPVSLREAFERAVTLSYHEIKYRAHIIRDMQWTPNVVADEGRLTQVFVNLLVNAAHAIDEGDPEKNEIRLRLWHEGEEVLAEVKDTGKGIDPHDLPYIFEPFFTTKERGVGTGLGLYVSNGIVTSLGGRIEVDSVVGSGTRFVIHLPVARSTGARPALTPSSEESR